MIPYEQLERELRDQDFGEYRGAKIYTKTLLAQIKQRDDDIKMLEEMLEDMRPIQVRIV